MDAEQRVLQEPLTRVEGSGGRVRAPPPGRVVFEEAVDEQRVAAGGRVQGGGQPGGVRGAGRARGRTGRLLGPVGQQLLDSPGAERAQPQAKSRALAQEFLQDVRRARARVGAARHHQGEPGAGAARPVQGVPQAVQGLRIGVLHVVDGDQDGSVRREPGEPGVEGHEGLGRNEVFGAGRPEEREGARGVRGVAQQFLHHAEGDVLFGG
ncbi:hypothetical protein GCM10020254_75670 [Streptomyces goshikiensis]